MKKVRTVVIKKKNTRNSIADITEIPIPSNITINSNPDICPSINNNPFDASSVTGYVISVANR